MATYILNSAVITNPGDYTYQLLTTDQAHGWLTSNPNAFSTIRYESTAKAFQVLFKKSVALNSIGITMEAGDEALVFRLKARISEKDIEVGPNIVLQNLELGLLTRTK